MKFLKYVLATIVGLLLFFVISLVILLAVVGSAASEKEVTVAENSVLKLDLDKPIVERSSNDPLEELNVVLGQQASLGLMDIKEAIKRAKTDDKIKGIYLEVSYLQAGMATLEEIRKSLIDFKKSKKFVITYGEIYSEGAYYLASVSDKIYLNPAGDFELNGLSAELIFFKGTLDKLGIEPQVFKVGEFKSAVEPFLLDKMSAANRNQYNSLLNSIYSHFLSDIAESRNIPFQQLKNISDSMLIQKPSDALSYKLITDVAYYDEVLGWLKTKLKLNSVKDIEFISLKTYQNAPKTKEKFSKNKIAVIVAEGEIVSSKSGQSVIASDEIAKEIRKARLDKNTKAVVLRINSPGGSALASDVMWREVVLTQKVKPIIASMSDYSASGGYYMAMGCDKIVAQPSTITGSIGIFGVLFNMQPFLQDKLGITTDRVKTGEFSDILTVTRPLNEREKRIIQKSVEEGYSRFITQAAEGRNMPVDSLKKIAEGRVWSGIEALEIGLVDELGGLDEAIALAAKSAKLDKDYRIKFYPEQKTLLENLLSGLSGEAEARMMSRQFGSLTPYVIELEKLKRMEGVQARMPYQLIIK